MESRPTLEHTMNSCRLATALDLPIVLTVGPDRESGMGGTSWGAMTEDDIIGSGGSPGRSKGERTGDIDDWTPAIRRAMRDLGLTRKGLRLADATIEPCGWSQGAGHAPQGVRVVWS